MLRMRQVFSLEIDFAMPWVIQSYREPSSHAHQVELGIGFLISPEMGNSEQCWCLVLHSAWQFSFDYKQNKYSLSLRPN